MEGIVRPRIFCSRCLEFASCRYDGSMIGSEIVRELKKYADIVHDCPEMGIGLGVPRPPVKVYEDGDGYHLYQTSTDTEHTEKMVEFVKDLLDNVGELDGFVLKAKSPSCGVGDVKIYPSREKGRIKEMGSGFLGIEVQRRFPYLAVETEKRLTDERIRDHFLTKLFTHARFRETIKRGSARDLIEFHSRAKYLLMAYDQENMRKMGRLVSDQKDAGMENTLRDYGNLLGTALSRGPRFTSHINVLMHGFGYVSGELSDPEKDLFLQSLELFRDDRIPLNSLKTMLYSWLVRFDVQYMLDQYYFQPYPIDLMQAFDGKRDRELWK